MTTNEITPLTKYQSLQRLVTFLEDKPKMQEKMNLSAVYFFCYNEDEWKEILAEMGTFTKDSTDYSLEATHTLGTIRMLATIGHEGICEKVLVGTKEVTKEVYPDDVKPETVTSTEDVYEWVCPPSWKA